MLQREANRDAREADQDEEYGHSTHLVTLPAWTALEIGTGVPVSQVRKWSLRKAVSYLLENEDTRRLNMALGQFTHSVLYVPKRRLHRAMVRATCSRMRLTRF